MKKNKKITEISELGEFKFIEKITNSFEIKKVRQLWELVMIVQF